MFEQDENTQSVLNHLSVLAPGENQMPRPAAQALAQLNQNIDARSGRRWPARIAQMVAAPGRRLATALTLAALLLVAAFGLPAVRAAASEFLSLFRVQKFAAISVSPEQLAVLQQIAEKGLTPGKLEIVDEPGALTPVQSLAEATAVTGLTAVRTLPALGEPARLYVADGGSAVLHIDVAGARAILSAAGADPSLVPSSVDGTPVEVVVFAGIEQQWADGTTLLQTESPIVDYPDGLDAAALGSALLEILGMQPAEAARLAQSIDWTTTLLLPIPANLASYSEVQVDGVSGIALTSLEGGQNAIIWQKDDIIYLLLADQDREALVDLANQVQ